MCLGLQGCVFGHRSVLGELPDINWCT